jgi:hypothetical protein
MRANLRISPLSSIVTVLFQVPDAIPALQVNLKSVTPLRLSVAFQHHQENTVARETLPVALKLMFGSEGGYSNSKSDSGGPTKFGIPHKTLAAHRGLASVTAAQVRAMTLQEATDICERSYWSVAIFGADFSRRRSNPPI